MKDTKIWLRNVVALSFLLTQALLCLPTLPVLADENREVGVTIEADSTPGPILIFDEVPDWDFGTFTLGNVQLALGANDSLNYRWSNCPNGMHITLNMTQDLVEPGGDWMIPNVFQVSCNDSVGGSWTNTNLIGTDGKSAGAVTYHATDSSVGAVMGGCVSVLRKNNVSGIKLGTYTGTMTWTMIETIV
jgi:hypothetical protein